MLIHKIGAQSKVHINENLLAQINKNNYNQIWTEVKI